MSDVKCLECEKRPVVAAVRLGFNDYFLPVDDAVALMGIMQRAEVFDKDWSSDRSDLVYKVRADKEPDISVSLVPFAKYAEAIIRSRQND